MMRKSSKRNNLYGLILFSVLILVSCSQQKNHLDWNKENIDDNQYEFDILMAYLKDRGNSFYYEYPSNTAISSELPNNIKNIIENIRSDLRPQGRFFIRSKFYNDKDPLPLPDVCFQGENSTCSCFKHASHSGLPTFMAHIYTSKMWKNDKDQRELNIYYFDNSDLLNGLDNKCLVKSSSKQYLIGMDKPQTGASL